MLQLASDLASRTIGESLIHWGAVAAALTAILGLAGTVWLLLRRAVRRVREAAAELRAGIVGDVEARLAPQVAAAAAELQPNGGSSLRDAVTRTERAVERVERDGSATRRLLEEHMAYSEADRRELRRRLDLIDPPD